MLAAGTRPRRVVVWGNCQAAPLAELLRVPLARAGFEMTPTPPVYLASETQIAWVHRRVREAAFLISQPIREEYRVGRCGTATLAAELPPDGRLVTVPTTFHTGPFPYLVNAHGADGARVDAPLTDYHDLRCVLAASLGMDVDEALRWWPAVSSEAVRAENTGSLDRLRRREAGLDVRVSDLVHAPDSLWSMNHPSNRVLARIATRVLAVLGVDQQVDVPLREFLGERRAPIPAAVADALGWPASAVRTDWVVNGDVLDSRDVVAAQLACYAARPDVVADTLARHVDRVAGLTASSA